MSQKVIVAVTFIELVLHALFASPCAAHMRWAHLRDKVLDVAYNELDCK